MPFCLQSFKKNLSSYTVSAVLTNRSARNFQVFSRKVQILNNLWELPYQVQYVAYCITDRESVRLANKRCVKRSRQYKTRYLQPTNQKAYISRRPIDSMDNYSWPIRMPVYLCTADQSESLYIYSWPIKKPVYLQPTNQKACLSTADQSKSRCQDAADQSRAYVYSRPIRKHGTFTSDQSDSPYLLNVDGFDHNLSRVCVVAFLLLLLLLINQVVLKYKKYNHLQ